jgi:hypothetical protein
LPVFRPPLPGRPSFIICGGCTVEGSTTLVLSHFSGRARCRPFMRLGSLVVGSGCPVEGAHQGCCGLRFPFLSRYLERGVGYLPGWEEAGLCGRAGKGQCVEAFVDGVEPITDFLPPHRVPVKLRSHVLIMRRAAPVVMGGRWPERGASSAAAEIPLARRPASVAVHQAAHIPS